MSTRRHSTSAAETRGITDAARDDAEARQEEAALFAALAHGDADALDALMSRLWKPLVLYALRLLSDADVAEDIAQESFRRLWESRGGTRPAESRSYLYRIARNLALDHMKVVRNRRRLSVSHRHELVHPPSTPEDLREQRRIHQVVDEAIQSLPARRREAFTLVHLRDFSYAEAAEIMDISIKTVEKQIGSAFAHLRQALLPLVVQDASVED